MGIAGFIHAFCITPQLLEEFRGTMDQDRKDTVKYRGNLGSR
jgi:hypothetical protein